MYVLPVKVDFNVIWHHMVLAPIPGRADWHLLTSTNVDIIEDEFPFLNGLEYHPPRYGQRFAADELAGGNGGGGGGNAPAPDDGSDADSEPGDADLADPDPAAGGADDGPSEG